MMTKIIMIKALLLLTALAGVILAGCGYTDALWFSLFCFMVLYAREENELQQLFRENLEIRLAKDKFKATLKYTEDELAYWKKR